MMKNKILPIFVTVTILSGCNHKIKACVYDVEGLIENIHVNACETSYPLRNVSKHLWDVENEMSFSCEDGAKLQVVFGNGQEKEFPFAYVSSGLGPDNIFVSVSSENDGNVKMNKIFKKSDEVCRVEAFLKN